MKLIIKPELLVKLDKAILDADAKGAELVRIELESVEENRVFTTFLDTINCREREPFIARDALLFMVRGTDERRIEIPTPIAPLGWSKRSKPLSYQGIHVVLFKE